MFLRQERQVLRRLPKYGCNLFLVRAWVGKWSEPEVDVIARFLTHDLRRSIAKVHERAWFPRPTSKRFQIMGC